MRYISTRANNQPHPLEFEETPEPKFGVYDDLDLIFFSNRENLMIDLSKRHLDDSDEL